VDGVEQRVAPGDMIWLPRGCRHTVKAETTLIMMEIQYGTDIDVADKIKHKL
jgi:mannose-1-phosphate guanylyltransferase